MLHAAVLVIINFWGRIYGQFMAGLFTKIIIAAFALEYSDLKQLENRGKKQDR